MFLIGIQLIVYIRLVVLGIGGGLFRIKTNTSEARHCSTMTVYIRKRNQIFSSAKSDLLYHQTLTAAMNELTKI